MKQNSSDLENLFYINCVNTERNNKKTEGKMFCQNCGAQINENAKFCPSCGSAAQNASTCVQVQPQIQPQPQPQSKTMTNPLSDNPYQSCSVTGEYEEEYSSRSKTVAAILGFLFGPIGIMDFYVGKIGPGITKILLSITGIGAAISMIWTICNMFGVASETYCDSDELPLYGEPNAAKILAIVALVWDIIAFVCMFLPIFMLILAAFGMHSAASSASHHISNYNLRSYY